MNGGRVVNSKNVTFLDFENNISTGSYHDELFVKQKTKSLTQMSSKNVNTEQVGIEEEEKKMNWKKNMGLKILQVKRKNLKTVMII